MKAPENYVDIFSDREHNEGFAYYDKDAVSSGWQSLVYGDAYSSIHSDLSYVDNEQAIKTAFSIVKSYLPVFQFKNPPRILITKDEVSMNFLDNSLKLELAAFGDDTMTRNQQVDVFMGDFFHEVCHFLYTDFKEFTAAVNRGIIRHEIHKHLWNIVEDERIERLLGGEYPGYVKFLGKMKHYTFGVKYLRNREQWENSVMAWVSGMGGQVAIPRNARLMEILFSVIRFPGVLQEKDIQEFDQFIQAVKAICATWPRTTRQAIDTALKLYALLEKEVRQNKQGNIVTKSGASGSGEPSKGEAGQSSSDKQGKDRQGDSGAKGALPETDNVEEKGKANDSRSTQNAGDNKPAGEQEGGEQVTPKQPKGEKGSASETPEQSKEEKAEPKEEGKGEGMSVEIDASEMLQMLENAGEAISQAFASGEDRKPDNEKTLTQVHVQGTNKDLKTLANKLKELWAEAMQQEADVQQGDIGNVLFKKGSKDAYVYQREAFRVKNMAKTLHKLLETEHRDLVLGMRSMKNGYLDTNKLVEAVQGVPSVYMQKMQYKSKQISAGVLVDCSSSMHSPHTEKDTRIALAKRSAILLNETFKHSRVVRNYFAYGYSSDHRGKGSTDIVICKEPGVIEDAAFGGLSAGGTTDEGTALWNCGLRMRKLTKDPIIFYVISDGHPTHRYHNMTPTQYVAYVVKKLEKLQIYCVHIGITHDAAKCGSMYPMAFDLSEVEDLPRSIGSVMKKIILRKIKAQFV